MIKINLLPYREQKKKDVRKRQIVVASASFGVFVLAIIALHIYTYLSVGTLEADVKASEARLKDLTKVAGEIDVIRADKKVLEKKIEIISNLE
jgi:Tfp pilus assembly protein PilN